MIKKCVAKVLCGVMVVSWLLPGVPVFAEENENDQEIVSIDISDLEEQSGEFIEESKYGYIVKTSGGNLNVRDWPVTGKVIATLPNGTVMESPFITKGKANVPGWMWISSPVEGYVCLDYVEIPDIF